ncbi:alpha-2-macroglobulin-like protein 1 [Alosa pseudoharengus]|uniref:alpha-2-macroglobulin-like protein 1 n=1 Tax=Alosa pseudoharengus TaxID=34774 RepID=UPI003F89394E
MALTRILIAGGLLLCLYTLCSSTATPEPSFLVTFPAQMRSASEAKLCASLQSPNETLRMSIYLTSGDEKKMLHQETSDTDFHRCVHFQAPSVNKDSVQSIKVEVEGRTSHWTSESRVKFRPKPDPVTFIQTDKPIYSPGQTAQAKQMLDTAQAKQVRPPIDACMYSPVYFRVVTMDTEFIPLQQKDPRGNTIGQWLNVSSERKMLQLSHALNPEADQGYYMLSVTGEQGAGPAWTEASCPKVGVSLRASPSPESHFHSKLI